MPRLSIEISDQQHQTLKATAALKGQSIKDYVLARAFGTNTDSPSLSDEQALDALAALLKSRIEEADAGNTVSVPKGQLADHIKKRVSKRGR